MKDVDWSRTRAYTFGLTGIYLNIKGREARGIVARGADASALKKELSEKLSGLRDGERDCIAIQKAYPKETIYKGPYLDRAPDIVIGYNSGYRNSWDAALGKTGGEMISRQHQGLERGSLSGPQPRAGRDFLQPALRRSRSRHRRLGPYGAFPIWTDPAHLHGLGKTSLRRRNPPQQRMCSRNPPSRRMPPREEPVPGSLDIPHRRGRDCPRCSPASAAAAARRVMIPAAA